MLLCRRLNCRIKRDINLIISHEIKKKKTHREQKKERKKSKIFSLSPFFLLSIRKTFPYQDIFAVCASGCYYTTAAFNGDMVDYAFSLTFFSGEIFTKNYIFFLCLVSCRWMVSVIGPKRDYCLHVPKVIFIIII